MSHRGQRYTNKGEGKTSVAADGSVVCRVVVLRSYDHNHNKLRKNIFKVQKYTYDLKFF